MQKTRQREVAATRPSPEPSKRPPGRRLHERVWRRIRSPIPKVGHTLYVTDVTGQLPEIETSIPVEVDLARPSDFAQMEAEIQEIPAGEYERRARAGDTCIVARDGERVAGFTWMTCSDHRDSFMGITIPLQENECATYDQYTMTEYRGHGIALLLHVEERKWPRRVGKDTLVFWLTDDVVPIAMRRWGEFGLTQTPVGKVTTYFFTRKVKLSRVRTSRSK